MGPKETMSSVFKPKVKMRCMVHAWILLMISSLCLGQDTYVFSVEEETEPGTLIGVLNERNFNVEFYDAGADTKISVNPSNGEIRVKDRIDREAITSMTFFLLPNGSPPVVVEINVLDINDNRPVFPEPYKSFSVSERITDEFQQGLGTANDPDDGDYSVKRFEIVDGNVDNLFYLETEDRNNRPYIELRVNHGFDYEEQTSYLLTIRAFDGGSLYGDLIVNISIEDINDNQPVFDPTQYFASITESKAVGSSVVQVYATDREVGENGRISYELQRRKQSDDDFYIVEDSGVIVVNKPLDYETETRYELIVVARDNGTQPLQSSAVVTIDIENVNDNRPVIDITFLNEESSGRISEDASSGDYIARISVSDADMESEADPQVTVELGGDADHFRLEVVENIMYLAIKTDSMDREQQQVYHLEITATDRGNPPLSSQKLVTLYVSDTNDNPPEFQSTTYSAEIEETAPIGSSVIQLTATDRDEGNNSVITYQIASTTDTYSDWFQIDNHTGLITTRKRIDCETQSDPSLTIMAYDSGMPPQSASATVNIRILNINDNQPIFEQSFYHVEVDEDIQVRSCILTVSATDLDCGQSESITYAIMNPDAARELRMRGDTGQLCVESPLDYERFETYEFEVSATDQDGSFSTANVKVTVGDVNDNRPQFYPLEYHVNLLRASEPETEVVVVQATDLDEGANGRVSYEIRTGNTDNIFTINSQTGAIRLVAALPSTGTNLLITVAAIDSGGLGSAVNAQITITILDAIHNLPEFTSSLYSFVIPEDADVQETVGQVSASVPSGGVVYSIQSGDQNQLFDIDHDSGLVKVGSSLDHDQIPYVLLNVRAAAANLPANQSPVYGQAQVNITILDVNDNPPQFGADQQEIMVREDESLNSAIYTAAASDRDSGDNGHVTYSLRLESEVFSISATTGELKLRQELDFESEEIYSLQIVASDSGTPQRTAVLSLTIQVVDVNDNAPEFELSLYNVEVSESASINTPFAIVTATDIDSGSNGRIVYSLIGPNLATFGIFPNDGSIYNKVLLDREGQEHYTVEVVAMDEGEPRRSAVATVSINVLDTNDNNPQFLEDNYAFYVLENKDAGTVIGTVSATDMDINDGPLRYDVVSQQNRVTIDSNTGILTTGQSLDRESMESVSVIVRVTDAGTPSRSTPVNVTVYVLDENDNSPRFDRNSYSVRIEENEPKNTLVTIITASDRDLGENATITYAFAADNADYILNSFQLNPQTGNIVLKERLDYEQRSQYILRVVAKDGGVPQRQTQTTVNVTVVDRNEARPEFNDTQLSITVEENTSIATVIGQVKAEDRDGSGSVEYFIVGGNQFGTFALNSTTGAILVGKPIDYEQSSYHTLQIRAIDSDPLNPKSSVVNVNISIKDVNDNPPAFEKDPIIVTIRENIPQGSTVHTFSATDADSGSFGQVRYEIKSQSPNNSLFIIEPLTGALKSNGVIDYETVTQISLVIRARDNPLDTTNQLVTTVTTIVLVENRNDNKPVFTSPTSVSVMEDEPVGYPIMNVIATDNDTGMPGVVNYFIVQGNEMGHFHIDVVTGLLTISKSLDRETTSEYTLNINARDNGSPRESASQQLVITVADVNDNHPAFEHPVYTANVYENELAGTPLITLTATDRDSGENAELIYLIPEGIVEGKFTIDATSGLIRTNATLDRELQDQYVLTAYVRDSAFPALYDTCTVTISVLDRNDNSPVFSESQDILRVYENTALPALYTVVASDSDQGTNGEVHYAIISGNEENMFSISGSSGQISCHALDREREASYTLGIEARDAGSPTRSTNTILIVQVLDENDNSPIFEQEEYTTRMLEDIAPGAPVLTVEASDADAGVNARITYAIVDSHGGPFRIDNTTGEITTTGYFDRERNASFSFRVEATDGGVYGPRVSFAHVTIHLDDVNDNAPVFEQIPYIETIAQNTLVGSLIVTVSAVDADTGENGDVRYSLQGNSPYFSLHSQSGALTLTQRLDAAAVTRHRLQVLARDRGQPQRSTNGVIEITVGSGGSNGGNQIAFDEAEYTAIINESASQGTDVVRVTASGQNNILYAFVNGNDDDTFNIDQQGWITVNNPTKLDYELSHRIRVIVEATSGELKAYTTVFVDLRDINDNPPRFTQDRYVTAVHEEMPRNTFVTQIMAIDVDSGVNGDVTYEIINQGDVDDVFIIDPPYTGIIIARKVLEAETRSDYKLIVAAYDGGEPQRSSTCTVKIQVIDVNDNVPYIPPQLPPVSIAEGVPLGTEVITLTATDTDLNHYLNYYFDENGNPDNMFSIANSNNTGRITVVRDLNYEHQNKYDLIVKVSDMNHTVVTRLQVNVEDINDNQPIFTQSSFQVWVDEDTGPGVSVLTVTATDQDAGENARITYSMFAETGFHIHADTGTIFTNRTVVYNSQQPTVNLVVSASDHGTQPYTAVVPVQVRVRDINNNKPIFEEELYRASVSEDDVEGVIVVSAVAHDADHSPNNRKIDYSILAGNTNDTFQIKSNDGTIYLVGLLDREKVSVYILTVQAKDRGEPAQSSTASVRITIDDVNDNVPIFTQNEYYAQVPENVTRSSRVLQVSASDSDYQLNGDVFYKITSGNDLNNFEIDRESGWITVNSNGLDHELHPLHHLTVSAIDSSISYPRQSSFVTVVVNVTDVNEYSPHFPVLMYIENVMEHMPIGTTVFTADANDEDGGIFGEVTYSFARLDTNFSIDRITGVITTLRSFDLADDKYFSLRIRARDIDNRMTMVPVSINVVPNFSPRFGQNVYSFTVPANAKANYQVGKVELSNTAQNRVDPYVKFHFKYPNEYFAVGQFTGNITVVRDLQSSENDVRKKRDVISLERARRSLDADSVALIVVASVGFEPNIQTSEVPIELAIDYTCPGCAKPNSQKSSGGNDNEGGIGGTYIVIIVVFVVIALILAIVIVALFLRGRSQRKKKNDSTFNSFNTMESMTGPNGYGPPAYEDAHRFGNGRAMTDTPATGSSGRGSVDMEEDEEIRMINATPLNAQDNRAPPDSGMQDDDAMSDHSVKDHQEYLARLGIDTTKLKINENKAQSVESMHQFSDEGGGEGDGLDTFQYNAIPQESMATIDSSEPQFSFQEPAAQSTGGSLSSVINSEEEFSGSYNWDYLLDWGPQYQPLADVFTEIARLKDDSIKPKKAPTKIVPQLNAGFHQNQQLRTSFPPPIITDAPPKGVQFAGGAPQQHSSQAAKPPPPPQGGVSAHHPYPHHPQPHPHSTHRERKDSSSSNLTVNSTRTSQLTSLSNLPKSPMSYESSFTTTPLSPDFENSLSPLQQHSPEFSPIVTPGGGSTAHSTGHNTPRHHHKGGPGSMQGTHSSGSEQEIHI